MTRLHTKALACAACALVLTPAARGDIIQIDPNQVTTNTLIDFNGFSGTENPGLNIDTILSLPGVRFGERFAGQTLGSTPGPVGDLHDTLTGTPTNPLNLLAGAAGRNLVIFSSISVDPVLDGVGPAGYPNFSGIGEGAISFLFNDDVREFRVSLESANGGTGRLQFFARDGSLLGVQDLGPMGTGGGVSDHEFGFRSTGTFIAGVSFTNLDPGGLGFDNLGFVRVVPEPATVALCGVAAFAVVVRRWRAARRVAEDGDE
jgi:hypothetical protein